jgi:hypothetical protein
LGTPFCQRRAWAPVESAGLLYHIGGGSAYFWLGHWDHGSLEPEFPRRILRVIWLEVGKQILRFHSTGAVVRAERLEWPKQADGLEAGAVVELKHFESALSIRA